MLGHSREERRGKGVSNDREAVVSSIFHSSPFPSFFFPKVENYQKWLRIKIMIGDVLVPCYKRNNSISLLPLSTIVTMNLRLSTVHKSKLNQLELGLVYLTEKKNSDFYKIKVYYYIM